MTEQMDEVKVLLLAGEYIREGWIGVSNKYCHIKKLDREDWPQVLAMKMDRAPADFYKMDGKPCENWKEHYIRVYSTDELTVHPDVYRVLKRGRF